MRLPCYSSHLRNLFHRFLLYGKSYTSQGGNPYPQMREIPAYIGRWMNLYWSLDEPILVTALTYITRQDDLYRFTRRPI